MNGRVLGGSWRGVFAVACTALLSACSMFVSPPPAAPLCGSLEQELGSVHLDYAVQPSTPPAVSSAAAEVVARSFTGGDTGTTCSVRLAKYDNLADHRSLVWVVHLDGLAIPATGGSLFGPQPRPSPPVLRRALVFVSTDAPPTAILTIAFGR